MLVSAQRVRPCLASSVCCFEQGIHSLKRHGKTCSNNVRPNPYSISPSSLKNTCASPEHSGSALTRPESRRYHPDGKLILSSCRVTFFHSLPFILLRMLWSNYSLSFHEDTASYRLCICRKFDLPCLQINVRYRCNLCGWLSGTPAWNVG